MPAIELLYWEGCPSHPAAMNQLTEALRQLGRADVEVRAVRVDTERQAREAGFVGSPTIRVDGRDVMPPPPGEPTGLNCRIYRLRDGRFSPIPDPAELREALAGLL